MPRPEPRTPPWLVRLLTRRRGPARRLRDLRTITEALRFSALFTALILTPVLVLATLAIRSLEAEIVAADADLQRRAERIASETRARLDDLLQQFIDQARVDIQQGNLYTTRLEYPGLRGSFRFDVDGSLVEPLRFADPDRGSPASPAWSRTWREGRRAEDDGQWSRALDRYSKAQALARDEHQRATAELAIGRVLVSAGRPEAEEHLIAVADRYPDAHQLDGLRVADLVSMLRARERDRAGDSEGAIALYRGLIVRALAGVWEVASPGPGVLASMALEALEGRVSSSWLREAGTQLDRRMELAHWAHRVEDDLRLIASRTYPQDSFVIRAEDHALWVIHSRREGTWAFSFDPEAIRADLSARVIDLADRIDPDLTARLTLIGERPPLHLQEPLANRPLAPHMPRYSVVVGAADPEVMQTRRRNARAQRTVVIVLAVFAAILGLVASVRLVNRELETASNKADFAANVSHELRSPITQIRLKAEALQLGLTRDEADTRAHYDAIVRQAEHLSRLVDNVLDFSAIERGVKRYTFRPEALEAVLLKAFQSMEDAARVEDVRLTLDLPDDLPMVRLDREAMGQVLVNLLSNAIKYGSDGDTVDVVVRAPDPDHVRISVRDHGLGIAPQDQERIFDYFYRVASTDVRRRRGTGIGLTIIRYIVEAHGGTITVDSELGRGSTFHVTLPLHPPDSPQG